MAVCAGVSVLYSTAEHGSRCGNDTSRLALRLYAARRTLAHLFATTGPLASVMSRCQSATAPGCTATSARLHCPPPWRYVLFDEVPDDLRPCRRLALGGRPTFQVRHVFGKRGFDLDRLPLARTKVASRDLAAPDARGVAGFRRGSAWKEAQTLAGNLAALMAAVVVVENPSRSVAS